MFYDVDKWAFRSKAWEVSVSSDHLSNTQILTRAGVRLQAYQSHSDPQAKRHEVCQYPAEDTNGYVKILLDVLYRYCVNDTI
jgi:hypothetical protein